ncbi:ATP-dependent DNA helicase [Pseudomonas luteola]|uniref:ATP-dependent DNA helicase n=1 Tax=Pseudomonas luteola TaxID=47886 RepID=UPI002898C17D|nr:ATP-dependent DNA helicase [Pseudomonas luteola]
MGGVCCVQYSVAVRALCEFVAKQGDLDLRFTPSPTALEGIQGHGIVTARRKQSYQREVALEGEYRHLRIKGRADGYDPELNRLEEIKTYRGDLTHMPPNHRHLHWAQAKIYGWLLCQKLSLHELELALVYFDVGSQKETTLLERFTSGVLKEYFERQCSLFLDWAEQELTHREHRQRCLEALPFPHASFRTGQRDLAEAVYKAAHVGCSLMIQAPTGIGKTIGTLFPLLKAMPRQSLDKVFFLTAKNSGRQLAFNAMGAITQAAPELSLRILELRARDKACEHTDKACHGESCPLAKGFYDRLPQARQAALKEKVLDHDSVRTIALGWQVCPYYLSQEMARWCDVIVGDYNYYFDSSAMLFALKEQSQWRIGILVDEAHNLLERARGMYTASLDHAVVASLRKERPPVLKQPLDRINRCWNALIKEQPSTYQAYDEIPAKLLSALQKAISSINDLLNETLAPLDATLQRFYFDAIQFVRMAESFGEHSLFELLKKNELARKPAVQQSVVTIRNVVPAPFIGPRFNATHAAILFSATLSPPHFLRDTLGLAAGTPWVNVKSPFAAEQLSVRLVDNISTRYQHREQSLRPIAELMAWQYRQEPGNYLAFFSSFDYLEKTASLFSNLFPDIPLWLQARQMNEADKAQFLQRFTNTSSGVGFVVLGGSFGEGVDLPGQRLIGAFIATLGLPQFNPANEQIRTKLDRQFGTGYDYAYFYPGMHKVIQAAGRVIRTTSDCGVLYLIDDRFAQSKVRRLLPEWWKAQTFRWPHSVNRK